MGMIGRRAPELRVRRWIGGNGEALDTPLKLSDLGTRVKILFAFQHWCSGCHSHGFPTLQRFYSILAPMGIGFAAIQTVFEGADENTLEKLNLNQRKYGLSIAFGHDVPSTGAAYPSFMEDYRSRGTPWFTVINSDNRIVFSDFHLDADWLASELKRA
jgi:hypothetical protein